MTGFEIWLLIELAVGFLLLILILNGINENLRNLAQIAYVIDHLKAGQAEPAVK